MEAYMSYSNSKDLSKWSIKDLREFFATRLVELERLKESTLNANKLRDLEWLIQVNLKLLSSVETLYSSERELKERARELVNWNFH